MSLWVSTHKPCSSHDLFCRAMQASHYEIPQAISKKLGGNVYLIILNALGGLCGPCGLCGGACAPEGWSGVFFLGGDVPSGLCAGARAVSKEQKVKMMR